MDIKNEKREKALLRLMKNVSRIKWYEVKEDNITNYISADKQIIFKTVNYIGKVYKYGLNAYGWEYQEKEYFASHLHDTIKETKPVRISSVAEISVIPQNESKKDKKKRMEEEKAAEEKREKEKRAAEKEEKERYLKENMFDVSLYEHIFLRENISENCKCEFCFGNTKDLTKGVYDRLGIIRMLRCKECDKCKVVYVKCPNFFGIDKEITDKMLPDLKSSEMLQMVEQCGIPIRKDGINAEEIEGGIFTSRMGNCPYDRLNLKGKKANILIYTKKGIENRNVTLGLCSKCNRYYMDWKDYNRLRSRGSIMCDIFFIRFILSESRNGFYYKGRCEKIASKEVLHNQKIYEACKDKINKAGFGETIDRLVRNNASECVFDGTALKEIMVSVNIIEPKGSTIETEFPAVCCTTCGIVYIHETVYKKIRQLGIPQCRIIKAEYVYSSEEQQSFDNWNLESKLHAYGYNVSGNGNLTDEQRQCILYNIIANGVMYRWEVVEHISFLIDLNKNKINYENAIIKWKHDLEFVNSLDLTNLDKMNPNVMIVKKRIK